MAFPAPPTQPPPPCWPPQSLWPFYYGGLPAMQGVLPPFNPGYAYWPPQGTFPFPRFPWPFETESRAPGTGLLGGTPPLCAPPPCSQSTQTRFSSTSTTNRANFSQRQLSTISSTARAGASPQRRVV